jgi:serine/threonine-protein phosphatase PGAM5
MMTHFLYLVRHGRADPHDGPLSEAGEEQARLTGQRLSEVPFSCRILKSTSLSWR